MNAMVLYAMALRSRGDVRMLRAFVERQKERRLQLFTRLADLLFGLLMFIFGDLSITVESGGKVLDASSPDLTPDQKITAILAGLQATNKGKLFRELARPLLVAAAELLAELLGPDDATLTLLTSAAAATAAPPAPTPAPAPAPAAPAPVPAKPAGDPRYEGKLLQANNGDPSVWHIVGGVRHGLQAPDVIRERYGARFVNGRWDRVTYVPPSVISAYPIGTPEPSKYEGKLLQGTDGTATVWHIQNGQRHGLTSPEALRRRYGSTFQNGRWSGVLYVPPSVINDFPVGSTES